MTDYVWLVSAAFFTYVALELLLRRFPLREVSAKNNWLDVAAFVQASLLVGPLIVYGTAAIETVLLPDAAGSLADTPWWLKLIAFLIFEDMVQYWYHRLSHKFLWMWPTHKFHHSPTYMGVRIVWRNGFFYDLFMPNIWFAGVLVYLGFGDVYFWYYLFKLVVTLGAHSEVRWDSWLYRYPVLNPLTWVIERTISTPATHFAHHATTEDDGIGHYNGNFGNLLFFWDVLFGTAHITRKYPASFGLPIDPKVGEEPWYVYIFYPIFRMKQSGDKSENGDLT